MADLSVEDFLGHDPSGGGGERGKFLRGWKKRKEVNIWLHTGVMFSSLWIHNLPRVVSRKNRETGDEKTEIWGNSWNCWEPESVLSNRKRDYDTGERESPITICPVCKMIEWVRRAIRQKALSPVDPIFRFVTPDGSDERIIHAAGLYNGLEDVDGKLLDEANIKLKMAWRENANSKCNYLFCVVDHDHPEDGVQIAIETNLLGDKMKAVMRRKRKKNGEDSDWNPLATPYAFAWEYHEAAKTFNEKYDADDRPRLQLTPDIEQLIKGDPPDLTRIKAPGRVRSLRDQLEQYATIEMPWDEFFAAAEAKDRERADEDGEFPFGANEPDEPAALDEAAIAKGKAEIDSALNEASPKTQVQVPAKLAPKVEAPAQKQAPAEAPKPAAEAPKPAAQAAPAAAPAPGGRKKIEVKKPIEEVFIPCDDCKTPMREDWEKCPKCGATYGVEPEIKAKYADAKPEPKPDAGTHGDKIPF
jgi:hypothetical protein